MSRRLFPALFLTLGMACVIRAGWIPPSQLNNSLLAPEVLPGNKAALEDLKSALESFRKRDYSRTQELLHEARKKDSTLPPASLMLARAFLAVNQLPRGRAALEQAAAEHADYPGVYTAFGNLALAEGRQTDALLHFEKAEALARSGRWTNDLQHFFLDQCHAGLASVAEERKDWTAARAALSAWLELSPDNGLARYRLGSVLFALDRPEEALVELRKAVEVDKTLLPADAAMAWLYARKGDPKKAEEWMEKAVQQSPKNARVHHEYARWLLGEERAGRAKTHAETAARLDPALPELNAVRGLIAWHLKEYEQAERFFQSSLEQAPEDFVTGNQLVLALAEQADEAKRRRALQFAERNVRLYPNSGDALATLAWVYHLLGRADDAAQAVRAARSRGTGTSDTAYYLARLTALADASADVKPLLRTALSAPGRFSFRKEARQWLDQLNAK